MQKELASCGDHAEINLQANAINNETVGVEGYYHVECRDASGNLKWTEEFPNQVVQVGKIFMFSQTLLTSPVSLVGPYLGLVSGTGNTFSPTDTMTSHAGWSEFIAYTVGGSAVRGQSVEVGQGMDPHLREPGLGSSFCGFDKKAPAHGGVAGVGIVANFGLAASPEETHTPQTPSHKHTLSKCVLTKYTLPIAASSWVSPPTESMCLSPTP